MTREWQPGDVALIEVANPTPPEPAHFAAVVRTADGTRYVAGPGMRGGRRWESERGAGPVYYTDLDVVEVLSEGQP